MRRLESGAALVLLTAAAFVAGCSDSPDLLAPPRTPEGLDFRTPDTLYVQGDTIEAVLSNTSDGSLVHSYFLCDAELQRRAGSGWVQVPPDPEGPVCTGPATLEPGESVTWKRPVGDDMSSGVHRVRVDGLEWMSGEHEGEFVPVISNEFRVDVSG